MNRGVNRQTLLLVLLLVATFGVTLWAWADRATARREAALAEDDARVAAAMSREIQQNRGKPSLASAERPNLELTTQIGLAAAASGLPADAVERIGLEQSARLTDDTTERTRQLNLRGVMLPQLASFLRTLVAAAGDLRVQSLRLTAPRDDADGRRWNVEVVVAYTVFEPARPTVAAR